MKLRVFLPAVVLSALACTGFADDQSILPVFGSAGAEFTVKAKDGNTTKGWLPKDWGGQFRMGSGQRHLHQAQ